MKPKTQRFTRTSKTQATFSTQRRLLFWTKKNVGLKEVCERQFGREWSSHLLTRKGDYVFFCHMRGTGHWRTSLAVYHMTSQPVHKPDEVRRFWTQRRNVLNVSPVFDLFFQSTYRWLTFKIFQTAKTLSYSNHPSSAQSFRFDILVNDWDRQQNKKGNVWKENMIIKECQASEKCMNLKRRQI